MFRNREEKAKQEAKRDEYLKKVLGEPGISLIVENEDEQKKKFQNEEERLAELVAEVSSSAQVTSDCNTLLADVNTLIKDASIDKYAVIGKFDKVKQRLIRAYDSREALPRWFPFINWYNLALLAGSIVIIIRYALIPGQKNLENTAYVCLACAIWGGVGGIVDAFLALHTHLANQDFDKQYWPWYYYHPILGLSMGAVIYLILQAGLLAISGTALQEAASANVTAGSSAQASTSRIGVTALPIVLAFLAGFRQRTAVDFLTRTISAIFQNSDGKK